MKDVNEKEFNAIALLVRDHREVRAKFEEFFSLEDDEAERKKTLSDAICAALMVHTQIEEEIFYPAVRQATGEEDMMDEAIVEHTGAKELIAQIAEMEPGDGLYDAKVKVLCEQIEHHVGEEESDMFPKASEADLDLVALGTAMAERQAELQEATA